MQINIQEFLEKLFYISDKFKKKGNKMMTVNVIFSIFLSIINFFYFKL